MIPAGASCKAAEGRLAASYVENIKEKRCIYKRELSNKLAFSMKKNMVDRRHHVYLFNVFVLPLNEDAYILLIVVCGKNMP